MNRLAIILAAAAAITSVALISSGFQPLIPGSFVLGMAIWLPMGWALRGLIDATERRVPTAWIPLTGLALAGLLLGLYRLPLPALVPLVVFGALLFRPAPPSRAFALAVIAVLCGYTALWGANYLALAAVRNRLADATALASDLAFYRLWDGRIGHVGLFPLVSGPLVKIFEASYLLFFPQLSLMLFVLERSEPRLTVYLVRLFGCYAVALLVFLVWPIVGPSLMYPESARSLSPDGRLVGPLMRGALAEFSAVRAGLAPPTTTLGYFVGMPSLHAAAAVLFQDSLRGHRLAFWTFLPINVLMAASTFVLGFHYVIDVIGGIVLAGLALCIVRCPERRADPERSGADIATSGVTA